MGAVAQVNTDYDEECVATALPEGELSLAFGHEEQRLRRLRALDFVVPVLGTRRANNRHFTCALTIVQANVHVRDLIENAFSEQLPRDGVTVRRSGPSAHPAATDQIVELRDQCLNWAEVAEQARWGSD